MSDNPLAPDVSVLVNLGSLAVHVEELFATPSCLQGKTVGDQIEGLTASAQFDVAAIRACLANLQDWLAVMDKIALLPKKR